MTFRNLLLAPLDDEHLDFIRKRGVRDDFRVVGSNIYYWEDCTRDEYHLATFGYPNRGDIVYMKYADGKKYTWGCVDEVYKYTFTVGKVYKVPVKGEKWNFE